MIDKTKSGTTSIIVGTVIFIFIAWKVIAYFLPDQENYVSGQNLLDEVMKVQGGLDRWKSKNNLDFTKEFTLYREDGTIELDREEMHKYSYGSDQKYSIQWREGSNIYALKNTNDSIYQEINGQVDTTQKRSQLISKLNAAQFVIDLPFSLNDDNAQLSYDGVKKFIEKPCEVLVVEFKDSTDKWWLYFTENDLSWAGYWVETADHYSLIINEEMTEANGFMLSRKRKSYRTDKNQNIVYLRAEYLYSNYNIY